MTSKEENIKLVKLEFRRRIIDNLIIVNGYDTPITFCNSGHASRSCCHVGFDLLELQLTLEFQVFSLLRFPEYPKPTPSRITLTRFEISLLELPN